MFEIEIARMNTPPPRIRWRAPLAWGAIWLLVILLFISENFVHDISAGRSFRWMSGGVLEVIYWVPFILATPLFSYMASQYGLERNDKRHVLRIHIVAAVAFALAQPVLYWFMSLAAAHMMLEPSDPRVAQIDNQRHAYAELGLTAFWKYFVIVAGCLAVRYHRTTQEAQVRAAQLKRELAAAELTALKMQLHPHFLFNALNSAAMLTIMDPKKAHEVLVQLAELLRVTLQTSAVLDVPLRAELGFLDRYLAIERIRFEDRLAVRFDVEDGTESMLVPSLILQPLVENAIRHGLGQKQAPGHLVIRSRRVANALRLEVQDDGIGLPPSAQNAPSFGVGLTNVQNRVNAANARPTPIAFDTNGGTGLRVTLLLPQRPTA